MSTASNQAPVSATNAAARTSSDASGEHCVPLLDRQEFDTLDPEAADPGLVAPLRQPRQHAPAHPHDDGGQQQEDQRGRHGRGRSDDERAPR
ncbi:MAG: hypothetical protein MZV64_04970 [Ignavibacteriales bacterium]|nr:hypothetical protein [Ignavibacteriales bacterium]